MEEVKLKVLNMIKSINESKTPSKDISCECKGESDGRKCNFRKK